MGDVNRRTLLVTKVSFYLKLPIAIQAGSTITGSNVNHCDRDGCTALMLSSAEDAEGGCVDYLLKVLGI